MAKKKNLSDLMRKRDNKVLNENPFEIKTNKRKHEVLGQKVMKWEKGKPGVSKSKWMKERMESLLMEHQNRNKDNRIKDKPKVVSNIPGKNDSAVQKFKIARKNVARLYNLEEDDDEEEESIQVTHKGRLLSEIEKFDDLEKDDEDEEDEKMFRDKFAEVQFGGPSEATGGKKDLSQMIFDSIVEKNERNKEKREQALLKETMMKEFQENMSTFTAGLRKPNEEKAKEQTDDLMMKLMMLKNAPRCTPADQVASPEKEKVKGVKMEQERLARMMPQTKAINHRSADDLDDDLYIAPRDKKRVRFADDLNDEDYDDEDGRMPDQTEDDDEDDDDEEEGESEGDDEEEEDGSDEDDCDEDGDDKDEEAQVDDNEEEDEEDVEMEEESEDDCTTKFAEMLEGVEYSTPEKLCEFVDALYKCSRKNPVGCARKVADAIYEHHLEFQVKMEKSKNGTAPLPKDFEMLFLVHLVGSMYSTSDYQHPVVTPTVLLLSQLLNQGAINSPYDVAYGLLLCSYYLAYVQDSKRFLPEVVNFLTSAVSLHSSERKGFYTKNVKDANMLVLSEDASSKAPPPFVTVDSTFSVGAREFLKSDEFKISSLTTAMKLAKTGVEFYSRLPSAVVVFRPLADALKGIDTSRYPAVVREQREELLNLVGSLKHPTCRLVRSECKPVPLPQLAPKLKEVTKKRNRTEGVKKEELTKYKKLQKGIQREVKKEQNLRNKIKFDELVHEKQTRKEKTRKIINELANQEGEINALRKRKKIEGKKGKVEKF